MADRRLRELERIARTGDVQAMVRLGVHYLRTDQPLLVLPLLHPLVKRVPSARPVFLEALPEGSHAFCGMCGHALTLGSKGYPLADKMHKGKLPPKSDRRMAKTKKYCRECAEARSYVGRIIANTMQGNRPWDFGPKAQMPVDGYCAFCGSSTPDTSHRCDKTLPSWITGGPSDTDPFSKVEDAPHWSD